MCEIEEDFIRRLHFGLDPKVEQKIKAVRS
jgi:hypothetical protein